jgi:glycine/D-amino acid oxidase-like deaminating enzyme
MGNSPDVLVLGQGLAGTLLGWTLERAGIPFAIADRDDASTASRVGAGIINPITGQRLVKSWRVDALLPVARATFREIEAELGVRVWHEMRVRRLFANDRERAVFAEKSARGELAPFATEADDEGFWIRDAARVDFRALLAASRSRWKRQARLVSAPSLPQFDLVIDCTGAAIGQSSAFAFVPWEFSKGEMLELRVDGLASDVVLNRRHWIVAVGPGVAWVGATHEPGVQNPQPSAGARALLEESARRLLGARPFTVSAHAAGVRVNLPDKRPIAGRHPTDSRLGLITGLAAKGALWAPWLARQWGQHLANGAPFDPEIDLHRFVR